MSPGQYESLDLLSLASAAKKLKPLYRSKLTLSLNFTSLHFPSLLDLSSDMPIAQTELFAPIFLVMPFSDVDDALRIANSTRYGLGASVFGGNRSECEFVAQGINSGMVNINDFGVSYLNQGLPFGGVKASGYGRFAGSEGLLAMTTEKAVTQDRLFSIIKTGIPPPLDYPMLNPGKGWTCESCRSENGYTL